MLNPVFVFDQTNYARYDSFHHVFLENLSNPQAFNYLFQYGFGGSSTGVPSSTIQGTDNFDNNGKKQQEYLD